MAAVQRAAFVVAGGGSLGVVEAGMLRALLAAGVEPDLVVGPSLAPHTRGSMASLERFTSPRIEDRATVRAGTPESTRAAAAGGRCDRRRRRIAHAVMAGAAALACAAAACAPSATPSRVEAGAPRDPSPARYRLAGSGTHWDVVGEDRVVEDLLPRYPEFFEVVLDPSDTREPDVRSLRDHLEQQEVDRRNFDALNAIAVAYFELNYRAESDRGGERYFADSFRAAKLLALPWRAYTDARAPRLRDAILDFFEDAATGEKLMARNTAGRVAPIVESLDRKESDPARRERIRRLAERARAGQLHE